MRLWSLHPKYLDVRGLVAVWREGDREMLRGVDPALGRAVWLWLRPASDGPVSAARRASTSRRYAPC